MKPKTGDTGITGIKRDLDPSARVYTWHRRDGSAAEGFEVVLYPTLRSCMEAYHCCPLEELDGYWEGYDQDGEKWKLSLEEAFKNSLAKGTWGWCEHKDRVHIWFRKNVPLDKLAATVAHELGHRARPWHRDLKKEEMKAGQYEDSVSLAVRIAQDLRQVKHAS